MSIEEIKQALKGSKNQEIEPILYEVQDKIKCLEKKLAALEEELRDAPQDERKRVRCMLEQRLADVMSLLTML